MEWKEIKSLLTRATESLNTQSALPEGIACEVSRVIGITVASSDVKVKAGTAYVTAHPAVKAQIALKKSEILKILQESAVGKRITDIR